MIGGTVKEILDCGDKVWIKCRGEAPYEQDECAVYAERNDNSLKIAPGDAIWWQAGTIYWTPKAFRPPVSRGGDGYQGVRWDIQMRKVGNSGNHHPAKHLIEAA